ncbi:hypothetical protein [Hornefia butyriciproducens]|uniref:hypothetical protein n=1 Tax=Hornefia butyriciproducens TaxID=2652293 RepID=UPI003F89D324
MNRQQEIRRIERQCGNFPSLSQIDKYLGKRKGTAKKLMDGIKPYKDGRAVRFSAVDVVDRLMGLL